MNMTYQVSFTRLIPESKIDNNPDVNPPNKRKVGVWFRYKKRIGLLHTRKYHEIRQVKEMEKLFCTTDLFCEQQICKNLLKRPNCPYARRFKMKIDRRSRKKYQIFQEEWRLEAWEYFCGHNYEWIDMIKPYVDKSKDEIPQILLSRMMTYFLNTDEKSPAYQFFRLMFPQIIYEVNKIRDSKKKIEEKKAFKDKQLIYRIGDFFYGEYDYLGDIKRWLLPKRKGYHPTGEEYIQKEEWEQYKQYNKLPEDHPFKTTQDEWWLYRGLRLIEERFFISPTRGLYGFGGPTNFMTKKEGLPYLRKFLYYFLEYLDTEDTLGQKRIKRFVFDIRYVKEDEFTFKTERLIAEIDEIHPSKV
jgi:hypothetical protein